jgi:hypothetical protein
MLGELVARQRRELGQGLEGKLLQVLTVRADRNEENYSKLKWFTNG